MQLTLTKLYNLALASLLTTMLFAVCTLPRHLDTVTPLVKQGADAAAGAHAAGQALDQGTHQAAEQVGAQSSTAEGLGKGIQADVERGRGLTPPDGVAALKDVWDSISLRAQGVLNVAAALNQMVGRLNDLNAQVRILLEKVDQLSASNKGLAAAATDAAADAAAARKEAAKATSQAAHITALVVALGIAVAGGGVALALMLKNVKIGIAGIGGALTIIILASILGEIDRAVHTLVTVAIIAIVVCGTLFAFEVLWRKFKEGRTWLDALATAVKTNPIQDIQDIIADLHSKQVQPA
jgi:hypothetical protein